MHRSNPTILPICALVIGLLPLLVLLGVIPLVTFPEEEIKVTVHPSDLEVHAVYVYTNPWPFPVKQGFGLPFPEDDEHPAPLPVELTLADTGESIPVKHWFGNPTFELVFAPHQTISVALHYTQRAASGNGTYLLTTARPWGKPLNRGVYKLRCDGAVKVRSNYPMSKVDNTWVWEKRHFMPAEDWLLDWREVAI